MHAFEEINHAIGRNTHTPLGQIIASGMIFNSPGIPVDHMRVFGNYALVYLLEGSGRFQDGNGYHQKVCAGDVLILFPEIPHHYGPGPGEIWNEFYTIFTGAAFDLWRKVGLLDPVRPIRHIEPIDSWLSRFQESSLAVRYAVPEGRTLEISRFLSLLTELLAADFPAPTEQPTQNWLDHACFLLGTGLNEDLDLTYVARRVGVSYESFRKRFQQQLGVSPGRYRMQRRMEAACDLLQNTSMTNQQVAESVGFPDEYYFYKRFKQIIGKTPRVFRQSQSSS